ncbi:TPA: ABC transporter permease [Bacillus cereus]|uniref:ABC transporter permease n=1 Tax=Bacillus cereus TaxID=1396 RepID=A0A1D3NPW8_BACCE|nr:MULTISPECIES: ABC transporter permease [Bacillus]MCG3424878.1 ABC transporter permease [Bacillus thuringiensis]MCP1176841.1 ABC transporter permease [Bacillus sp. 1663tsa1]MCP1280826.1 ABC transporter permease [Bacillus sp. S0635]MCQ6345246.1 ABC transporter permease [Bacillus cereus]MCU5458625.1 ABC transporter permease [Bacillus cereus]
MLRLMKLELKKFKLGWYVRGAIIANIAILALMILTSVVAQVEGDPEIRDPQMILLTASTLVRATFIIFGSVLIARLIISEYKNKTILLMFSYPIDRRKMMSSKLAITAIVTFITVILSNILVVGIFFGIDSYFSILPNSFTVDQLTQEGIKLVPLAVATAGISLIPLYFGMRKRSVPATIVSSLIVVSITMNTNPAFSTATFLPLQLALAVIGVVIAYYGIKNIEKEDVTV